MALVAIDHYHPIDPLPPRLGMLIEMPDPFQSRLIIYLAIRRGLNDPRERKATFDILGGKVIEALYN